MLHVDVTDDSLMDFVEMQKIGFVQRRSQMGIESVICKTKPLS